MQGVKLVSTPAPNSVASAARGEWERASPIDTLETYLFPTEDVGARSRARPRPAILSACAP